MVGPLFINAWSLCVLRKYEGLEDKFVVDLSFGGAWDSNERIYTVGGIN